MTTSDETVWTGLTGPLVEVCGVAASSSKGRRAVLALERALRKAGFDALARDHVAPLVKAEVRRVARDGGVWLDRMRADGRIGDAEMRAGVDIRHALALVGLSGAVVGAVDPSKVVVDGGAVDCPARPSGGRSIEPCVLRYDAWRRDVLAREERRRSVSGSKGAIPVVALITSVLVEGVGTSAIEATIGAKRGRVERAVLAELRAYARRYQ